MDQISTDTRSLAEPPSLSLSIRGNIIAYKSHRCGQSQCSNQVRKFFEEFESHNSRQRCHTGRCLCTHDLRCIVNRGLVFILLTPGEKAEDPIAAGVWIDPNMSKAE